ncbi:MAG: hypothetical protein P1V97_05125 [Planctomycetota bacterium]|nr:hypothetical protein [Planctomycetota bacterium]
MSDQLSSMFAQLHQKIDQNRKNARRLRLLASDLLTDIQRHEDPDVQSK